ncbi:MULTISPECIES: hypothetical protein [Saccharothrix]|uniref:hypothetical protein n=1 Tax=Saccharothrix TaxID=2071 RepID=UPI00093E8445|nr:hypothetical protein [Saccharothrix sp. CB00851]OKI27025.1 hypothetical protein A6A25_07210 [Saccharothrix sp. CB00851]
MPVPYRPPPPKPEPDADGWYRDEDELYRTPWIAVFKRQWDWLTQDPATLRDHGWTVLNPVVGGVPALLPVGLIAVGAGRPLPFGVVLVAAGFAVGPLVMHWQVRWTPVLLGPSERTGRTRAWAWIAPRVMAVVRLASVIGTAVGGLGLAALHLVAIFPTSRLWWPEVTALGVVPGPLSPLVGVVATAAGLALAPLALPAYARVSRLLLAPTKAAVLARRVDRLTAGIFAKFGLPVSDDTNRRVLAVIAYLNNTQPS